MAWAWLHAHAVGAGDAAAVQLLMAHRVPATAETGFTRCKLGSKRRGRATPNRRHVYNALRAASAPNMTIFVLRAATGRSRPPSVLSPRPAADKALLGYNSPIRFVCSAPTTGLAQAVVKQLARTAGRCGLRKVRGCSAISARPPCRRPRAAWPSADMHFRCFERLGRARGCLFRSVSFCAS